MQEMGWIPGPQRFLREGNGNPLQYSYLGNLTERGAWQATVHGVAKKSDTHTHTHKKSDTTKRLNDNS